MKPKALHAITALLKLLSGILVVLPTLGFNPALAAFGAIAFIGISAAKDLLISLGDWIDNGKKDGSYRPPFGLMVMGLTAACCLSACTLAGAAKGLFIGYTGSGVEITGMAGDLTGAGYDLKTKKAYIVYADGHRSAFNITGAGLGAGQLALYLEGGGKIIIDTKTAKITTGSILAAPKVATPAK